MRQLTRREKISISLILVICFSLTTGFTAPAGCGKSPSKQTTVRTLSVIEDDVATGLESTAKILNESKVDGSLSQADIDAMKPILQSINEANDKLISMTEKYASVDDIPESDRPAIIDVINQAAASLTALNNEGMLRIKNPTKRAAFNVIVLGLQSAATSAALLFPVKGVK